MVTAILPSPGPTLSADPTPSVSPTIQNGLADDVEEEEEKDPPKEDLLNGMKLFLAFFAMMLSLFLVALDVVSFLSLTLS
jgi:hypothetical protein